jgi:DNA polymerase III epsilon subunit-like protein
MQVSQNKYIAFDCETSGVSETSNLLTISFLILDKDLIQKDSLNISLKQTSGYNIYPEALQINRIDIIKHHQSSSDLQTSRKILLDFLNKNKGSYNLIPIGHNIAFDIRFIKSSGLLTDREYSNFISCNPVDTLIVAQFLKTCGKLNQKQSLSLINLCNHFKLDSCKNSEHTSEYDIKMTIKLLHCLKSICNTEILNEQTENSSVKRLKRSH